MAAFKKHLLFFITLIVLVLLAVGGLTYIFIAAGKSSTAARQLSTAELNLRSALSLTPAPTQANLEASEQNVAELKQVLATQIASTKGVNSAILEKKPPATGTNMYYDLLAYKNELDKDAKVIQPTGRKQPGVTIPANFDWGFSRYLQAGAGAPPKDADIPALFRQKEILNYLLRKLLATQPQSIVSVQREPVSIPRPAPNVRAPGGGGRGQQGDVKADEFWIGAETSAVPGVVTTTAFRITFTGYSQNLRAFLKEIAAFELPLVVRSVEVKPTEKPRVAASNASDPNSLFALFGGNTATQTQTPAEVNQEPVVETNISEFTVVIEYIDVTLKS